MDLCKVRLTYLDPCSLLCSLLKVFLPRLNSHFQMSGVKLKLSLEVSLSNRHTHKYQSSAQAANTREMHCSRTRQETLGII